MTGRSHLMIGTATAAAGVTVTGCTSTTAAVVVGAAAVSAKLPDWDLKLHIPHRGPTHTLIACCLLTAMVIVGFGAYAGTSSIAVAAALGVLTGYGMHLAADACTPHGVPVFWPFIRRDMHLLPKAFRITTGSATEVFVVMMLTVATALLIYHAYV